MSDDQKMTTPAKQGFSDAMSASPKHKEAFCLMEYRDQVTGESEWLWNSRDGVTPFIIPSRRGNRAMHVHMYADRPVHIKPAKGMRIFVDAKPDMPHIIKAVEEYVNKYWGTTEHDTPSATNDMRANPTLSKLGKEGAIKFFIAEWTQPGSPTIVEVE